MKTRLLPPAIYILLLLLLVQACRFDNVDPGHDDCLEIPPSNTGGYMMIKRLPVYDFPSYNPQNSNEIIFRLISSFSNPGIFSNVL